MLIESSRPETPPLPLRFSPFLWRKGRPGNVELRICWWLTGWTGWWLSWATPRTDIWVRQIGSLSQLLGKINKCSKPPTRWCCDDVSMFSRPMDKFFGMAQKPAKVQKLCQEVKLNFKALQRTVTALSIVHYWASHIILTSVLPKELAFFAG